MEGHVFSYFYFHKFLIYFHVFISKIISFSNYILGTTFLIYFTMPAPMDNEFVMVRENMMMGPKWFFF